MQFVVQFAAAILCYNNGKLHLLGFSESSAHSARLVSYHRFMAFTRVNKALFVSRKRSPANSSATVAAAPAPAQS